MPLFFQARVLYTKYGFHIIGSAYIFRYTHEIFRNFHILLIVNILLFIHYLAFLFYLLHYYSVSIILRNSFTTSAIFLILFFFE